MLGGLNMEYIRLGTSDLNVSRICLGCMGFGRAASGMHAWTLDEAPTREIIRHALELGINFFDTALAYQGGTSEQFVGRALKDMAKREDVVVATKFLPMTAEQHASGMKVRDYINGCLAQSLKNMGLDYIDLYIYHCWDAAMPVEEVMGTLNEAVKAGKVRYIGISNCFAWQIAKANFVAEKYGWSRFITVQGHYNLLFREEEVEMAPYCADACISMTPYSALAAGRLARSRSEVTERLQKDAYAKGKYDATAEQDGLIIDRVGEIAEKRGVSRTQIALAWLLTKVAAPVVGATKIHQLEDIAASTSLKLTPEECAYLEEPYVPHRLVGMMKK